MSLPNRCLSLAVLPLLFVAPTFAAAAPAAPTAIIIYGSGETITHLRDLAPGAPRPPNAPPNAKLGWLYERFHIWWADLWTWNGQYVLYSGNTVWPLTDDQVHAVAGKSVGEIGKPFLYRFPLGLLILLGIILLCVVASRFNRNPAGAAPPMGPLPQDFIPERPNIPVHCCYSQLYQPEEVLRERLPSPEAMAAFMKEIDRAVSNFAFGHKTGGRALSLFVALRPGRRARFWAEARPEDLSAEEREALLRQLEAVPPLEVQGLVAAANYYLLWGVPATRVDLFAFVPREWAEAIGPEGGVLPDDPVNKIWPG
jgi:hypothetical protein